jgi:hypothetical protein
MKMIFGRTEDCGTAKLFKIRPKEATPHNFFFIAMISILQTGYRDFRQDLHDLNSCPSRKIILSPASL